MDFVNALSFVVGEWQRFVIMVSIVCPSAIFMTGMLKAIGLNKLKSKWIHKPIFFFTGISAAIGCEALYFVCDNIPFDYFIPFWIAIIPMEVLYYAFYEYTGLRNGVDKMRGLGKNLGKKFFLAVFSALANSVSEKSDANETKLKLIEAIEPVKKKAKNTASEALKELERELKNL